MDNLRSVLKIVLSKIPAHEILNDRIRYNNITREDFVKIAGYYVKNYSNDELENMFSYICNEYERETAYMIGKASFRNQSVVLDEEFSFSVFDAVFIFAIRTLQEEENEPVCQYENILRWRMTAHELDEDIFTTAFLAMRDEKYMIDRGNFSWRPVIRHNNKYLNKVLSQGMADNHFHLKGSAPQFPLSWLSMMNQVTNRKTRKLLESYSKTRLSATYYTGSEEEHLYIVYLKAALIRCYLFARLTGNMFILQDRNNNSTNQGYNEEETERTIRMLLQDKDEILFYREQIQDNIRFFRDIRGKYTETLDYALNGSWQPVDLEEEVNGIISGERWFLYAMFRKIGSKSVEFQRYCNWFYAYLVIKCTIRSELVQTNENIGFDNFARYQDRKEDFIENTGFEHHYFNMALRGTIINQDIQHLEVRISPKKTAESNRNYIRKIEKILHKNDGLKNRFFYVFHFVKEKDDDSMYSDDRCYRHYRKRNALRKQAFAITKFREKYPEEAVRLKGIDACAKEIGCRPEVFAQTYRYLRNHMVYPKRPWLSEKAPEHICQLSLTYHIGEDYLDIIDGLRAIDECVHFLDMDCGSRIGHALALGTDVEEFYATKHNKILISQQDYLDNLVWLYYRIKKFKIHGFDDVLIFIEQEYNRMFRQVYGNYICDDFFHSMLDAAKEHFRKENEMIVEGYCNSHFLFRMSEYYSAWKLRGDNPKCYQNGYFEEPDDLSTWERYSVNSRYPFDYRTRYNPECAYLYYLYHYSSKAKIEGSKKIEINVSYQMIECVKAVQKGMQRWFSHLGIGIETNPSSNYLIGLTKRYDELPIFEFYNLGLAISPDEIRQCPQIPVCVNTDDQGIFSTYLENEYALLALALEKARDEDGNNKYERMMIYQWIDNIRKMGMDLSFAKSEPEYK